MSKDIFISHAVKDKNLADELVDLLIAGLGIHAERIFCSSIEGMKIPKGVNFVEYIKSEIQAPKAVIVLASPNYFASQFCLCELGATWAMSHTMFPLLVPPLKYADVKGVLTGIQLVKIDNDSDMSEMADELLEILGVTVRSSRWERKRGAFIAGLPKVLAALDKPGIVSLAAHQAIEKKLADTVAEINEIEEENALLKKKIDDLSKAKDKKQVIAIRKKYSTDLESLSALEDALSEALKLTSRAVSFLAFRELGCGQDGVISNPYEDRDLHDLLIKAKDQEYVTVSEDGLWSLDRSSTDQIEGIVSAFDALQDFILEADENVSKDYRALNKVPLSLSNRKYWETALDSRVKNVSL